MGGARETPGSAAAGVGVAAAGEGAGSAARVGSDSKESPISGCQKKKNPQKEQPKAPRCHCKNEQNQAQNKCPDSKKVKLIYLEFYQPKQNPNFNKIKVEKLFNIIQE